MSFQQSYERNGAGNSGAIVFYCICLQPAIKGAGGDRCHWIASNIFYGREERKLAKYVVKRVLLAVVTMFLICFITFFTMNAIHGGPFNG